MLRRAIATAAALCVGVAIVLSTSSRADAAASVVDVFPGQDLGAVVRAATSGQTIVVHAGSYGTVYVADKAFTDPVTIQAAPGESATVAAFTFVRDANVTVSGLTVTGILQVRSSSGVTVANNHLATVQMRDGTSNGTIRGNTISNGATNGASGVWVHNITSGSPLNDHITIVGNDVFGHTEDAVTVGASTNVVIQGNTLHDTVDTTLHNDGIQLTGGNGYLIQGNRIWNHDEAMMIKAEPSLGPGDATLSNVVIQDNLMYRTRGAGIIVAGGTSGTTIANNTIVDNVWADVHLEGTNTGVVVANDVLDQLYLAAGTTAPAFEDHNCIRVSGGSGARDVFGDPQFVDHADYHLSTASPCRGTGDASHAPSTDFLGTDRHDPQDMGAYQDSVAGPAATEVWPGTSLDATVRQAPAGATIVVHAGTYPALSLTSFAWSTPLTIAAAAGESPVLTGIVLDHVSNLVLDGIGASAPVTIAASTDVTYRRSDAPSVAIKDGSQRIRIIGDVIHGGTTGVALTASTGTPLNCDITISGTTVRDVTGDGVQLAAVTSAVIEGSRIDGTVDTASFQVGIRATNAAHVLMARNQLIGWDQAVTLKPASGATVDDVRIESSIASRSRGAGFMLDGASNVQVVNNTLLDNYYADLHLQSNNPNLQIWNNVLRQVYRYTGVPVPALEDWNAVQIGGAGLHDLRSDPQITDRTTYRPTTSSPVLGAGTTTGAPADDFSGAARTGAISMGAWQTGA